MDSPIRERSLPITAENSHAAHAMLRVKERLGHRPQDHITNANFFHFLQVGLQIEGKDLLWHPPW